MHNRRSLSSHDGEDRHHANLDTSENHAREAEDEGPACNSCRKRKAKCSRVQPCSQCERIGVECVYDDRKMKPGLKTGAIQSLTQRLTALEHMFMGQSMLLQPLIEQASSRALTPESNISGSESTLDGRISRLKSTFNQIASGGDQAAGEHTRDTSARPNKRRRHLSETAELDAEEPTQCLPAVDLVDSLVEIYFARIHPWIPILHVRHFRDNMRRPERRPKLKIIFQAIVTACARFSCDSRLQEGQHLVWSRQCKQAVILNSTETFSVEGVQALVIVAFDTIGGGRGPSSWSIVGSITRSVEQLQLSVEDPDHSEAASESLIRRFSLLRKPKTWIESEERRRIFWTVFAMDRFCSVTTGWNTSLTSTDARRRLPCEGALWEAGSPVQTPFFGIADQAKYADKESRAPNSQRNITSNDELKHIGGFAFCIEATENLNLVTNFFLKPPVNLTKKDEVQLWIMSFKELDLRLVQWKHFLPEKWRDASNAAADGFMDPNLTLAHLTHNTALILLHQAVAYPSPQWQSCLKVLSSASSAESCLTAAMEISTIGEAYLQSRDGPTHPQFSFCLFIAGRVLLAHSAFHRTPLEPFFWNLVSTLRKIGERWDGSHGTNSASNLATKFASRLASAQCLPQNVGIRQTSVSKLDIRDSVFREPKTREGADDINWSADELPISKSNANIDINSLNVTTTNCLRGDPQIHHLQMGPMHFEPSPSEDSVSLAFPPLPFSFDPFMANVYAPYGLGDVEEANPDVTLGPMMADAQEHDNQNHV